jgi:hypothetical protein
MSNQLVGEDQDGGEVGLWATPWKFDFGIKKLS